MQSNPPGISPSLLQSIGKTISHHSGRDFYPRHWRAMGGGCINQTLQLSDAERHWLVKLNRAERLDMFQAEAAGLEALAGVGALRVPRPLCSGVDADQAFLVLEYIEMGGAGSAAAKVGEGLAVLHRQQAEAFGWGRDNYIGATPQPNAWQADWVLFWREQRLGHQLALLQRQGLGSAKLWDLAERLLDALPVLLDHRPVPSLLHGDLWGGNLAQDRQGRPVIFDPAVYYGDREADLAMTELFGGFGADFYAAYQQAWPLDAGYRTRKTLYNLYHILNHANLFGGSYLGQAQSMLQALLAAC
jgi:fructosamine-3-kinase